MSAEQPRVPKRRFRIGALLAVGVLINYFDRISLSVAGPQLSHELGLGPEKLGVLFSAFFWSYAILQIPTGVVLDRFGVKTVGRWGAFLWGLASTLTALAGGYGGVLAARTLLGIAEAPAFPASSKATGYWFPRRERARATSVFDAAAKFSNVIGVPLVAYFVQRFGWRSGFGVTAALSFAYFVAFARIYRDPGADKSLTPVERSYIRQGDAAPEGLAPASATGMLRHLLTNRKVWGLTLGFAAYGYSFYLFVTWLPGYLVKTFHLSIMNAAGVAAIPWSVATIMDLAVGGWLVDHLIARGFDETRVRKTVLLVGMCMGLAVFGATQTTDLGWATAWISVALGGLSFAAPVGWSLPSLIAPRGGVGTVAGIMNGANNVMGGLAPLVTGYIVGSTDSFAPALVVAVVILGIGIASFAFLLGKIEPIPEPGTA